MSIFGQAYKYRETLRIPTNSQKTMKAIKKGLGISQKTKKWWMNYEWLKTGKMWLFLEERATGKQPQDKGADAYSWD